MREAAVVCLFSRVIDLAAVNSLIEVIPINMRSSTYKRIGTNQSLFVINSYTIIFITILSFPFAALGILNALNPLRMDNMSLDLDLRMEDERRAAFIVTSLFFNEGGYHFINMMYKRTHLTEFIPGWELPEHW